PGGRRLSLDQRLFPEDHLPALGEARHQVLRALEDEIPAQVGEAEDGLTTSGMRPGLWWRERSAIGAREPLSVQGRIPFLLKIDTRGPLRKPSATRRVPRYSRLCVLRPRHSNLNKKSADLSKSCAYARCSTDDGSR